jgi:hypothetical protein
MPNKPHYKIGIFNILFATAMKHMTITLVILITVVQLAIVITSVHSDQIPKQILLPTVTIICDEATNVKFQVIVESVNEETKWAIEFFQHNSSNNHWANRLGWESSNLVSNQVQYVKTIKVSEITTLNHLFTTQSTRLSLQLNGTLFVTAVTPLVTKHDNSGYDTVEFKYPFSCNASVATIGNTTRYSIVIAANLGGLAALFMCCLSVVFLIGVKIYFHVYRLTHVVDYSV